MTDAELLAHPEFLALCLTWETQGRAPLPGADWLAERGMDGEAAAWEWAATEPDRHDYRINNYGIGGLFPRQYGSVLFSWYFEETERDDLPSSMGLRDTFSPDFATFPAAILWFLRRSAEVYGPAGPPSSIPHEAAA